MIEFVVLIFTVLVAYFYWISTYWSRRGVKAPLPFPFVGNMTDYIFAKKHFGEVYENIYKSFPKAGYVGIYRVLNEPAILVRDLDLLKTVFIKDFNSFHDNYILTDKKLDPLVHINPFIAEGEQWKVFRAQMGQLFTPSKVKTVFPIILQACAKLQNYVENNLTKMPLEAKTTCAKYTIEVIASAGFGLEAQAFTNPDSYFTKFCENIFSPQPWSYFQNMGMNFWLEIAKIFKAPYIPEESQNWLTTIVRDIIKTRKSEKERRNDLFEAILNAKESTGEPISEETIFGHSATLLLEGFETSSTTMAYCLYELAKNAEVLKNARIEVDKIYEKYQNQLSYEAMTEMTYLESVLLETLRLHPAMLATIKKCTENTTFPPQYPGSKSITIPKGSIIVVPVLAVHYDPENYPEPYIFNPDRFSEQSQKNSNKCSFLAFGEGPRICIGMRLGLAQTKAGIAALLRKYNIRLSSKTKTPLVLSSTTFLNNAHGGIWIDFEPRSKKEC